jgi:Rrf2 family protein
MLSKRAKYGLRALVYLAQRRGEGPIQIRVISKSLGISGKFLEAILLQLRNESILTSRKGKEGGYQMERSPDTITIGRVVRLMDGALAAVPCVSQFFYSPCADCPSEQLCTVRWIMKQVRDSTAQILDNTTLDQMVGKAKEFEENFPMRLPPSSPPPQAEERSEEAA